MRFIHLTAGVLFAVFMASCRHPVQEPPPRAVVVEEPAEHEPPPVPSTPLNDIARYLAGMPSGAGNPPLDAWRATPEWARFRRDMDELWRRFADTRLPRVAAFSHSQLGGLASPSLVWYPFSGPDILFAETFFPGAPRYELCGLESCEMLPDFTTLSPEEHLAIMEGIRSAVTTSLSFSYFITKDMRVDLQRTRAKGTLPVVLVFLARMGCSIESVEPLRLEAGGMAAGGLGGGPNSGYRVRYRQASGAPKTLCYFTVNLSDSAQRGDRRYLSYIQRRGAPVTYLKSASYLLHTNEFTLVRQAILDRSAAILQDDSGVPLRFLRQGDRWDLTFYGNYTGVLDIFKEYWQPDLAEVYQTGAGDVRPIDFGLGYKFEAGTSALILARRR